MIEVGTQWCCFLVVVVFIGIMCTKETKTKKNECARWVEVNLVRVFFRNVSNRVHVGYIKWWFSSSSSFGSFMFIFMCFVFCMLLFYQFLFNSYHVHYWITAKHKMKNDIEFNIGSWTSLKYTLHVCMCVCMCNDQCIKMFNYLPLNVFLSIFSFFPSFYRLCLF